MLHYTDDIALRSCWRKKVIHHVYICTSLIILYTNSIQKLNFLFLREIKFLKFKFRKGEKSFPESKM